MAQQKVSGRKTSESGRSSERDRGNGNVEQERDDVEEGEGDDGDEGSAGEPLELLALEREARAA